MTQEQALEAYKAMYPEKAEFLAVERMRKIGYPRNSTSTFYLWDYSDETVRLEADSDISWEHALAQAKTAAELWTPDNSPITEAA